MSIPSWAVRGAEVICIKRNGWKKVSGWGSATRLPEFGERCRIESVKDDDFGVYLELFGFGDDDLFNVANFRPLVTEKDDLATHFEQYLKTDHRATRRVGEDA